MSSTNKSRKTGFIVLGIVLALILALVAGEWYMRHSVANSIRDEIGTNTTGEAASVSFGATPLLLSIFTNQVSRVEIDTPSTVRISYPDGQRYPDVSGTPQSHILVTGLDVSGDSAVAGTLELETTINNDYLQAELQREFSQALNDSGAEPSSDLDALATSLLQNVIQVSSVSTDTGAGTLTIEFNDGLATVAVRPELSAGQLSFDDVQSTLLGLDLPAEVNESLAAAINSGLQLGNADLSFEKVEVQDNGLYVVISGTDVVLDEVDVSA